jgi:hypothetical protein
MTELCDLYKYNLNDEVKEDEMARTCSMNGREEEFI